MSENMEQKIDQIKDLLNNKNMADNLGSVINMFSKQNQNKDAADEDKGSPAFDPQTLQMLFKIQNMLGHMKKSDDSREKLLIALKPHLNKDRQDALDNVINILKLANMMEIMKKVEGSDKNAESK